MQHLTPLLAVLVSAPALAGPELAAGYHGDFLTHPGAFVRAGWPTIAARKATLDLEFEADAYWHPKNMVALGLRTGPALRVTGPRHGTWGLFAQVGGLGGTWAAPTYAVDEDLDVSRTLGGHAWLTGTAGLELGRELPRSERLTAWFVRPSLTLRLPTAHRAGYDLALQVGVRFGGFQ